MPTEEVVLPEPEGSGEPQQEVTQQPEPETLSFKVRGEERQITASNLDAIAGELGTSREAAMMWLQTGKDAGQVYGEIRQRERTLAEREAQVNAYYQKIEEERQRQAYAPPPQAPASSGEVDPIAILQAIRQEQHSLRQQILEDRQQYKAAIEQQEQAKNQQAFQAAFSRVMDEKSKAKMPTYSIEDLEQEAVRMGLGYSNLTPEDIWERAYRSLAWDQVGQARERSTVEKLRDPKAKITVPGTPSSSGPSAPVDSRAALENQLEGLRWGEVQGMIPERR